MFVFISFSKKIFDIIDETSLTSRGIVVDFTKTKENIKVKEENKKSMLATKIIKPFCETKIKKI